MFLENPTPPPLLGEVEEKIKRWAETVPQIKRVYLFGSFVKGKKNPSDIDIAVEIFGRHDESAEILFFIDHEKELTRLLGYPIDLQKLDEGSSTVRRGVEEGAIVIFERLAPAFN